MVIPVFEIADYAEAVRFYVDWLGFKEDWTFKSESNRTVYTQISKGDITLHLTDDRLERNPGKALVAVEGLQRYYTQLIDTNPAYQKPQLGQSPWNSIEMEVVDPFENRLLFNEQVPARATA